jgi:serine protease Do
MKPVNVEQLNRSQFVLLVLLVSFVTSLFTAIVIATLVNQAPAPITQTVGKVIEKTVETVTTSDGNESTVVQKIVSQEDLIVSLVENVSSAVVSVVASKDLPVIEQYFINPFEGDEFFEQFFPPGFLPEFQVPQYRQKGTEKRQVSSGSGFFVSGDGFLLTNKHVVEDTTADYSVIMNDGRRLSAKVLARDPVQDIAILKVASEGEGGFNYIPLGDSKNIKVGQTVIAIGNALGEFENTVSVGVISGLNRTVTASGPSGQVEQLRKVIQTDAAINPGNSGGPLLNLEGRAIGINTAVAQGAENIGFALPITFAKKGIADVKEFGKVRYAFLGVRYLIVTPDVQKEKGLAFDYGALLIKGPNGEAAIMSDSPASKAGLQEGDIILELDGVRITKEKTLAELLSDKRVGQTINLQIWRGEELLELQATLDERPASL